MRALISVGAAVFAASSVTAQVPRAISADPPRDSVHPARMEVLHIPSGGVNINGVAYIASGPGAHPAFIFFNGLPGNERSEEHTSELQSRLHLVCRLLLEKKKKNKHS